MKTLKLFALSLIAGGILFAQQTAPISGGGPIPPSVTIPIAPSNQNTWIVTTVSTDPTPGSACYGLGFATFNYVSQSGFACVLPPGTVPGTAIPTWQRIFGNANYANGFGPTTLTGATIAPAYKDVFFNGTTALVTITPQANIADGQEITIVFTGSSTGLTWTAAGNINVAGTATTSGSGVRFVWSATLSKWVPLRLS